MIISNWGNYPQIEANFIPINTHTQAKQAILSHHSLIARGLGRCYGDSALNSTILDMRSMNRILAFNDLTGEIECEAGVSFSDIVEIFVPRGWFLPVTPGTKFVTVGGAIASDVHGKNHHKAGSLSSHILSLELLTASGEVLICSPTHNSEIFYATMGGMGLTGVILSARFKLIPISTSMIRQEKIKAKNLDHVMELFEQSDSWTYSVAWIDCLSQGESLGRSILMRGEHATLDELPQPSPLNMPSTKKSTIPFNFPNFALNSLSVKAFNFLYYHKAPQGTSHSFIDFDTFFYPLDAINHWNRIYGKRGFTQYQFVIPKEHAKYGLKKILSTIAQSGQGSFLAVLKLFGKQESLIGFPYEGYTLALDFALTPSLFPLLNELDQLVQEFGGRLYLTKDVRMSSTMFQNGYPHWKDFWKIKSDIDPYFKFMSLQSQRIFS